MKLIDQFNNFLDGKVNLNQTRFALLITSVDAVKTAIRGFDWGPKILGFAARLVGSRNHH